MTHPIVKTVSNMVFEGNIDSAERALAVVADEEGDKALALVIEEMAPRDLVAILREHDSSRGSIISELISPKQFLAAATLERNYRDPTHRALKGMVNAVVFADEDRTDEFIEALGSNVEGLEALCDYFGDRHEELEFFFRNGTYSEQEGEHFADEIPRSNDDLIDGEPDAPGHRREIVPLREVQDHDWRELGWRLRCEHYEIFRDMLEMLRARHHKAASAAAKVRAAPKPLEDDDDEDDVL